MSRNVKQRGATISCRLCLPRAAQALECALQPHALRRFGLPHSTRPRHSAPLRPANAYKSAGQLTSETNPMGYATTYSYNNFNELTSTTEADGRRITYSYNHSGQETGETWWQGMSQTLYTATYSYNTDGQLTAASDPFSSYTYTYNAAGEEASVSNHGTPGAPTVTLSFGYDVYGNRTSLSDSLGGSISYSYNADQEMTGLGRANAFNFIHITTPVGEFPPKSRHPESPDNAWSSCFPYPDVA